MARELADVAEVRELFPGEILIEQKSADNDFFFILSGTCRIFVNGREVAIRHAGQHVGEMVIIDPSLRRTATVIASEQTSWPTWTRRLSRRWLIKIRVYGARWRSSCAIDSMSAGSFTQSQTANRFSSSAPRKNSLLLPKPLPPGLPKTLASVTLWSDGVFGASTFAIERSGNANRNRRLRRAR